MSWFKSWFDTKYYHILYKDRDYQEANAFISNLVANLNISKESKILDLACGKGRHSIFLNGLGFDVEGVDLSEQSINLAKRYESARLKFDTHDMREIYKKESFDYVFNLFTSFGYFENDEENQKSIDAMYQNLETGGTLVLDFMNAEKVIVNLVALEVKTVEGIDFNINRKVKDGFILKEINFSDDGKDYSFSESVKAIKMSDFKNYFSNAGFTVSSIHGDYALNKFDSLNSDRLIFVCKK